MVSITGACSWTQNHRFRSVVLFSCVLVCSFASQEMIEAEICTRQETTKKAGKATSAPKPTAASGAANNFVYVGGVVLVSLL